MDLETEKSYCKYCKGTLSNESDFSFHQACKKEFVSMQTKQLRHVSIVTYKRSDNFMSSHDDIEFHWNANPSALFEINAILKDHEYSLIWFEEINFDIELLDFTDDFKKDKEILALEKRLKKLKGTF